LATASSGRQSDGKAVEATSAMYTLPAEVGGVLNLMENLLKHPRPDGWSYNAVLTDNRLDRDTRFEGRLSADGQWSVEYGLPLENVYSVLWRLARAGFERLGHLEQPSAAFLYLTVRGLLGPAKVRDLVGVGEAVSEVWTSGCRPATSRKPPMISAVWSHYLQNQLLKDTVVMGAAHPVEVRVPYLDHELANTGYRDVQ
jgi:hypothetical protein